MKQYPTTREELAQTFALRGYKRGAEIGVHRAAYSTHLMRTISGLELFCVDPWVPYFETTVEKMFANYAKALRNLRPWPKAVIWKTTSLEASIEVANGSLDFVYIDGQHDFDNVMLDIILWAPKVRKGGIVSGHDYNVNKFFAVLEAVSYYRTHHEGIEVHCTQDHPASFWWEVP